LRRSDENYWERKPQPLGHIDQRPGTWCGRPEQILLNQVGCEARKRPAVGDVFFLDFYLYRTNQELATGWENREREPSNFRQSPEAVLIDCQ